MHLSHKSEPHQLIEIYPLPSGETDVFLRKNERTETDEEGNNIYVAEEVYFRTDEALSKKDAKNHFDALWDQVENPLPKPSREEKLEAKLLAQERVIEELMFVILPEITGGGI